MDIEPHSVPPQQKTIRKQLGTLCTQGVEPYWVIDNCPILLGLRSVHDRAGKDGTPSEEELVAALVNYLRDAVSRVNQRQHQILLKIVLAIDEDEDFLGMNATNRRTIAGERFRGGRRIVTFGTIRQHHEPRALEDLARVIAEDEDEAAGASS